jgi:hypothetical protein
VRHEATGYHLLLRDTGRAPRARAIGLWLDDALRATRALA